jgi:putative SOS response-associated peptidase YedK
MCNDYGLYTDYADYLAAFSQTRIPVKWPDAIPNLQPRDDIWPTDKAPVIRRLEDGTNEFSEIRWGFPPAQPKRPPIINFGPSRRRSLLRPIGAYEIVSLAYRRSSADHRYRSRSRDGRRIVPSNWSPI